MCSKDSYAEGTVFLTSGAAAYGLILSELYCFKSTVSSSLTCLLLPIESLDLIIHGSKYLLVVIFDLLLMLQHDIISWLVSPLAAINVSL